MEPLFEGLTASEIEYLKQLEHTGYFDGFLLSLAEDTSSDYRVKKFSENGYIILHSDGPYPGSLYVTITGKGKAALVDYDKHQANSRWGIFFKILAFLIPTAIAFFSLILSYRQIFG